MTRRVLIAALVGATVAGSALYGCYLAGVRIERMAWERAVREAKQQSDSLVRVTDAQAIALEQANLTADSALAAWQALTDSIQRAPRPIRYVALPASAPVVPARTPAPSGVPPVDAPRAPTHSVTDAAADTVSAVLAIAGRTITTLDSSRRVCLLAFDGCRSALHAANQRAERAEAEAARVRTVDGRRARWQLVERSICGTSLATNLIQWRLAR